MVVTGGGTGGHIYPALAVAEALKTAIASVDVQYVGGREGMEAQIVPPTGIPCYLVSSKKLRRILSPSTAGVLFSLCQGYVQAAEFLRKFRPDVVISTGGYMAAATALAAARQRIPTIIQEYNAFPGRTNRWLSRWATRICVWFDKTRKEFPPDRTVTTGVPLRADIVSTMQTQDAREAMGLDTEAFTIVVIGGSQGARRVNELVVDMIPRLSADIQVFHQTGTANLPQVQERMRSVKLTGTKYHVRAYLNAEEITTAYRAADLIICRCGISTLAEAAVNSLPMLMIPLPSAYADHQTANARVIEDSGAGIHLPEATLTAESLALQIGELRRDQARRLQMSAAARSISKPNAAVDVATLASELAG